MIKHLNKFPLAILVIIVLTFPQIVSAQEKKDSLKVKVFKAIQDEFPRTRTFNLEYDRSAARSFNSELVGEDFTKGDIAHQQTIDFTANIPLFAKNKWTISSTGRYVYNQFEFDDLQNLSNYTDFTPAETLDFHYFSVNLNSTLYSSLFNKMFIYNGSIILDGSNDGLQRIKALLSGTLLLKRTANTTMTVGIIAMLDPTSQIPFFPLFTYNHKFKDSNWEFDAILPQRLIFKKPLNSKSRISIGTTFGADAFYLNENRSFLPSVYSYSQLKIDGGLTYERKMSNSVFATVKFGGRKFISNRLTEKNKLNKDYIYKNDQSITSYFNIGVSVNPFNKKNK